MHTEIVGGDLEGAAGAGRGLFEDQCDGLTLAGVVCDACLFLCLEVGSEVEQARDLLGREVQQGQKILAFQIHIVLLFSRAFYQLLHGGF